MITVQVNASTAYEVRIGSGLLQDLSRHVSSIKGPCKTAIITDSHVGPLYAESVASQLTQSGFQCVTFTFPAGEASKNPSTYLDILRFLAEHHLTRSDLIIALGGGVTGDMAGFAAATYLRGIDYIQIPTSLLSMVDSSVGGKTAIDLPQGKNLVGAFHQPRLVLCDTALLQTLPEAYFRDGCGEVIKYGVLYDADLFSHLLDHGYAFDRYWVISRCVSLKRDVVALDEFDTGARQKLNLGHTLGHGIEAGSHFTISHGCAVAAGMAMIARAAANKGICDGGVPLKIEACLNAFSLPTNTHMTAEALYRYALSDKKRSGQRLTLIIPEKIGFCRCEKIPVTELRDYIEAGL